MSFNELLHKLVNVGKFNQISGKREVTDVFFFSLRAIT